MEGLCISKWVGLENKNSLKDTDNSLKQLTLTVHELIIKRLIIGRICASVIWGAYFWEGLIILGEPYCWNFVVT